MRRGRGGRRCGGTAAVNSPNAATDAVLTFPWLKQDSYDSAAEVAAASNATSTLLVAELLMSMV